MHVLSKYFSTYSILFVDLLRDLVLRSFCADIDGGDIIDRHTRIFDLVYKCLIAFQVLTSILLVYSLRKKLSVFSSSDMRESICLAVSYQGELELKVLLSKLSQCTAILLFHVISDPCFA